MQGGKWHLKDISILNNWLLKTSQEDWANCVAPHLPCQWFFLSFRRHVTWRWLNLLCFSSCGCFWCSVLGTCPKDKTIGGKAGHGISFPTFEAPAGVLGWGKAVESILISVEPTLVVMIWNGMCTGAEPSRDVGSWRCCVWYRKGNSWSRESKKERTLKHIYLCKAPLDAVAIFHWVILRTYGSHSVYNFLVQFPFIHSANIWWEATMCQAI